MEYITLAELYKSLDSTTKRIEKTKILADFLKDVSKEEIDKIMLLVQGLIFPKSDDRKIGVASKLVIKALNIASGITVEEIEKSWKKTGDLGISAEELISKKKQHTLFSEDLTVNKVFSNMQKLSTIEGLGSTDVKLKTIAELLTSAKPIEARYIVRLALEDLRVGLGEGTLRDSLAIMYFEKHNGLIKLEDINFSEGTDLTIIRDKIQEAYDITNDYAEVAKIISTENIDQLKLLQLSTKKPVKVMLAQKAKDIKEAFEMVGTPCAVEYKYDGFRMIIGKDGSNVTIHTRRLENVSNQFPEVVELIKKNIRANNCIIDGEAVGYNLITKKYVPFQNISQRIRRKYDIENMAKEIPVELNVFDIVLLDGKSLIKEPYENRRKILEENIIEKTNHIRLEIGRAHV